MILKPKGGESRRDGSFLGFVIKLFHLAPQAVCGCGKVGIPVLDFHFSISRQFFGSASFRGWIGTSGRGCGNVGISLPLRDFQEAVERVEKRPLVFHSFHRLVISTALCRFAAQRNRGGNGDSTLHARNSFVLAAPIFFAHSVSLSLAACLSS